VNTERDQPSSTPTRLPRLVSLRTARRDFFGDEISLSMLRKLIGQGVLPCHRVGRRVLLSVADLSDYMARCRGAQ
jgi:excisionase family DNA binding protein